MASIKIEVVEQYNVVDGEVHCLHNNYEIVEPCCSSFQPLIECACQGTREVVCPNVFCDGITDAELERMLDGRE